MEHLHVESIMKFSDPPNFFKPVLGNKADPLTSLS